MWMAITVAVTVAIIVFFASGGVGTVIRMQEGRRQHQLDLKREEARIAEARVRELELQQKRAELEYREALLELERFDRRTGTAPAGPTPPLDPPDPTAEPPDPTGRDGEAGGLP